MPEGCPHLLTLGPSDEPHWVHLAGHPIGEGWTAIQVGRRSLHRKRGRRLSGKYKKLVTGLSRPVADLHLSARPAACLRRLGVRYVYELVKMVPLDLRGQRNFGQKSLREVRASWRPWDSASG